MNIRRKILRIKGSHEFKKRRLGLFSDAKRQPFFDAGQRPVDDLVDVQILLGAAPSDKSDVLLRPGQRLTLGIAFIVAAICSFYGVVALHAVVPVIAGLFLGQHMAPGIPHDMVRHGMPRRLAGGWTIIGKVRDTSSLPGHAEFIFMMKT